MKLSEKEEQYLRAKEAYYDGDPIISDDEFDILEAELKESGSSVIDLVGFKTKGTKIQHLTPMKSLDKVQFKEGFVPYKEFHRWLDQNSNESSVIEVSPKFDGNAVNLIYKKGKLWKSVTRGDGKEGMDVTAKMRRIVPTKIPIDKRLEIRGEVVISVDLFNKKYSKEYKNPRNFVAGMLGRDNLDVSIADDLKFMGFEIKMGDGIWMNATFDHLEHWGFEPIFHLEYYIKELKIQQNFIDLFEGFLDYREECPYQLDGFVMKFGNEMRTTEMEKDHHPKWALAVKFPPKIAITKIIDIEWNLGSTGILVPTAILESVDLDGSTVSRVTLHNYQWARDKKLGKDAVIEIIKSGDIIPKVYNVVSAGASLVAPTRYKNVPVHEEGVNLIVENVSYLPEFKALKLHQGFVVLGMKGIGPAMAQRLVDAGFETLMDVFSPLFEKETLIRTEGFVDGRELEILLEIVNEPREIEYWKIIAALRFDGVGAAMSKQIANYINGVDYDFTGLDRGILESFLNEKSRERTRIRGLVATFKMNNNIEIIFPTKKKTESIIGTFEVTGSPKDHGFLIKEDFIKLAKSRGYIHDKLTKNSSFLITDDLNSSSSKMSRAAKLGVKIITYSDFNERYLK